MVGRVFLGRYEVIRLLGEGGMGIVYLARQLDLGRQVVVKVMHDRVATDPQFRERFLRETLLMARFQHPYVVTLYDASLDDPNGPCIIMEYIRGITLDRLQQNNNGRLHPIRTGRLLGQLCEVLHAAHQEAIIHRDLKPSNLMVVDPDTPYEKIKVMDFGLAKLHRATPGQRDVTASGEFAIGTPAYMCPEQARGQCVDHRGDLYSVGIILYELLTGRLPFSGPSTMEVLLAQTTESPPSFAAIGAAEWLSPALEQVIMACLAKNPSDRPQSALELAERYEMALADPCDRHDQPVLPSPPPPTPAPRTASAPRITDPDTVVHCLEAWMPETIATCKLRGFVQDVGGEVLESVPGRIRVRLGGPGSIYQPQNGPFSWLGFGRKSALVDVELLLQQTRADRANQLQITVQMRSLHGEKATDPAWRERCDRIYCDLRGYLMGQSGTVGDRAR